MTIEAVAYQIVEAAKQMISEIEPAGFEQFRFFPSEGSTSADTSGSTMRSFFVELGTSRMHAFAWSGRLYIQNMTIQVLYPLGNRDSKIRAAATADAHRIISKLSNVNGDGWKENMQDYQNLQAVLWQELNFHTYSDDLTMILNFELIYEEKD